MKERLGPLSGPAKPETQLQWCFWGAIGYKGKTSHTLGAVWLVIFPGDLVLENHQSTSLEPAVSHSQEGIRGRAFPGNVKNLQDGDDTERSGLGKGLSLKACKGHHIRPSVSLYSSMPHLHLCEH